MKSLLAWIKLSTCRLSLTLGIFCYIEIFFQLTEGTNPNYQFPWGHYNKTLAIIGAILLTIAYVTRTRPQSTRPAPPH